MVVSEIELYEMLKAKIGNKEAGAFVEILEKRVDKKFEEAKQYLATKEDIAQSESRLTMKMFLFWIGAVGALSGIIFAMLHAYLK